MTNLEKEKLSRFLQLLIDAYCECFRAIEGLGNSKTPVKQAAFSLVSKESELRQAYQELHKTLKGIP